MTLFRTKTPDSTVWKRFRSGQDGFTFTRTGDIYEAKVVANSERVVDLFYTLSELMAPAVDVYIEDARTKTHRVVDVDVAIDIGEVRALCVFDEDREW